MWSNKVIVKDKIIRLFKRFKTFLALYQALKGLLNDSNKLLFVLLDIDAT